MSHVRQPASGRILFPCPQAGTGILVLLLALVVPGCFESDPNVLWEEAKTAFQNRDYKRAETLMARIAKLREPAPEDHMLRAQLAMTHDDVESAFPELEKVPGSHELGPRARLQMGQIELRRHRARFAEKYLLEAAKLDPGIARAHKELIFIYGFQLRRAEMGAQFAALAEIEPLSFEQVFLWCLSRGVVWEPQEASEKLGMLVDADPEDVASRLALVETLRRLNRPADAEKRLAPISNDNPEARALRAQMALDAGDEAACEALLKEGPKTNLSLALLRGRIALAHGDGPAAATAFRAAVAADPDHRDAILGLSQSLRMINDPEAPRYAELSAKHERLNALVQRSASSGADKKPELLKELGAACAAIGRYPEARSWYALAIGLNPLDSEAQAALYKIKDKKRPAS